jgi:N-acetylneuraminate synthase
MKPDFVAEFTTNHMGNLNLLLRMVESAAEAGCTYIKMQKKDVETFYTEEKLNAPYTSPYGQTYRDYRTIFEFSREDFERFDRKCEEQRIAWFATVQDVRSLCFMLQFDLPLYKIASCNARNLDFLREVERRVPARCGIVVSVGGSTLQEVEAALNVFHSHHVRLLHVVSEYPCSPDSLRLGNISVLRQRFGCDSVSIGYSGHEEGITPTFAAVDLGAEMIERHFCVSRRSFVHHIECSLEPHEYRQLIDTVRSGVDLRPLYANLPAEAFACSFGMSAIERTFLVEQKYGRAYIGRESQFDA